DRGRECAERRGGGRRRVVADQAGRKRRGRSRRDRRGFGGGAIDIQVAVGLDLLRQFQFVFLVVGHRCGLRRSGDGLGFLDRSNRRRLGDRRGRFFRCGFGGGFFGRGIVFGDDAANGGENLLHRRFLRGLF